MEAVPQQYYIRPPLVRYKGIHSQEHARPCCACIGQAGYNQLCSVESRCVSTARSPSCWDPPPCRRACRRAPSRQQPCAVHRLAARGTGTRWSPAPDRHYKSQQGGAGAETVPRGITACHMLTIAPSVPLLWWLGPERGLPQQQGAPHRSCCRLQECPLLLPAASHIPRQG